MAEIPEMIEGQMALSAEEQGQLIFMRLAGQRLTDPEHPNVPEAERDALLAWASQTLIAAGLLGSVLAGNLMVTGMKDGEPEFRLTDQGTRYVEEELLPAALRHAAEHGIS